MSETPHPGSILSLLSRTRRLRFFLLAALLAATMFVVGDLNADATRIGSAAKNEPAAIQAPSDKRLPVARVILSPKGFAPAEITRPKGPFILTIHNRSKIDDLNLSLAKVAGNKVREMKFQRKKLDWRSFITLPPGDYALSVAERPGWVCNIKINAN